MTRQEAMTTAKGKIIYWLVYDNYAEVELGRKEAFKRARMLLNKGKSVTIKPEKI